MASSPAQPADATPFMGSLHQGETFQHPIGRGLFLRLLPQDGGWHIYIGPNPEDDFASVVTPPMHGPNPLDIMAWTFNPDRRNLGLGLKQVRTFQFVLNKPAYDAELQSLNDLAYGPRPPDGHERNTGAAWGSHKMGHCWLRPDHVTLTGVGTKNEAIATLRFTASCALSGGTIRR
jgi:hypothetical protein